MRWDARRVLAHRACRVRDDLEREGVGIFMPTYRSIRYEGGHEFSKERVLISGYIFTAGSPPDDVDGLLGYVGRVRDREMARLIIGDGAREWDEIAAPPPAPPEPRRSTKPRRSNRLRKARREAMRVAA